MKKKIAKIFEGAIEHPRLNLNPVVFPDGKNIDDDLVEDLKELADHVVENCPLEVRPANYLLVGSSLSYQYSSYSDLDLHIQINMEKIGEAHNLTEGAVRSLLRTYVRSLSTSKNKDWTIRNIDVEFYFQDVKEDMMETTPGIFDLTNCKWIKYPEKADGYSEGNLKSAKKEARREAEKAYSLISQAKEALYDLKYSLETRDKTSAKEEKKLIRDLISQIKLWRTNVVDSRHTSVRSTGIFSSGNLIFKLLQRWTVLSDVADELDDLEKKLYDV